MENSDRTESVITEILIGLASFKRTKFHAQLEIGRMNIRISSLLLNIGSLFQF